MSALTMFRLGAGLTGVVLAYILCVAVDGAWNGMSGNDALLSMTNAVISLVFGLIVFLYVRPKAARGGK